MTSIEAAAWLPFSETSSWDEDEELAVEWIEQQCAERGEVGLVVVEAHAHDYQDPDTAVGRFVARNEIITSRTSHKIRGRGPALAYTPGLKLFGEALRHARGSALCVLAGPGLSVNGWARDVGALNLRTGKVAPPLPPAADDRLGQLMLYANNAFRDSWAKTHTPRLVERVMAAGVRAADMPGLVMSRGASHHGGKRIAEILRLDVDS